MKQALGTKDLLPRLKGVKSNGKGWLALCPAHDDHSPSLSVNEGEDGRVLIHCFAGCSIDQVCTALRIELNGLGPNEAATRPHVSRPVTNARRIVATYDYTDEREQLLFQVLRCEPKSFRQRRPDGKGGWTYNLNGTRRVLYRLPDLLQANQSALVFVTEGEKDAERLIGLGLVATTNPGGAGKWVDGYSEDLRGFQVCILPDNDEAGHRHAQIIASSLIDKAASVRILTLPNLPEKGDVTTWLDAGGTHEELQTLADQALTFTSEDLQSGIRADEPEDEMLQRLTALTPIEYERERQNAAAILGCSTSALDRVVKANRSKPSQANLQGSAIDLGNLEPWPDSVNGEEVLTQVAKLIGLYVFLPAGAADVLALWSAHTYVFDAFLCSPRLNITSPIRGCGKTTLRDLLAELVSRPLATEGLTSAVLFRLIQGHRPTLLADEYDAWLHNEELRGLLNSGHRRGGRVFRCEGESKEVRGFNVFAPALLAGIGSLPGTLHDRSIVISLLRARQGEVNKRFDRRRTQDAEELCRKLKRFCIDNRASLEACNPVLPNGVINRLADNWRPLFAIAEIAGGNWPERAVVAFGKLNAREDPDGRALVVRLLGDIRQVFQEHKAERIFSQNLVTALCGITDGPWREAHGGREITETWLARRLRPFNISPKTLRIGNDRAKGYELVAFSDAFERYLPPGSFQG